MSHHELKIGRNIKLMREHKQWNLDELADRSNLSRSFISRLENDQSEPSLSSIYKVAKALEVTIDDLLRDRLDEDSVEVVKLQDMDWDSGDGYNFKFLIGTQQLIRLPYIAYAIQINQNDKRRKLQPHEGFETLMINSGEIELYIQDPVNGNVIKKTVGKRESITFQASLPHSYWNKHKTVAYGITIVSSVDLLSVTLKNFKVMRS